MAQMWNRQTPDRKEQVVVTDDAGVQTRTRVVENTGLYRMELGYRISQIIWILFGVLESLIVLRIILKLIAANPANPFANLIYSFTDLFLWPFAGLTVTPAAGGMVLEIPSIIALFVYALLAWLVVRLVDLLFARTPPTRIVETYEEDHREIR